MVKRAAIIYHKYLDENGKNMKIGGIETYIHNLLPVLREVGYDPFIVQVANEHWRRETDFSEVYGLKCSSEVRRAKSELFDFCMSKIDLAQDLIIFGADHASVRQKLANCISIQHGISWDVPSSDDGNVISRAKKSLLQVRYAFRAVREFDNCINRVCVDYNFPNWYNSQPFASRKGRFWVVPNFSPIECNLPPPPPKKPNYSIIFARRLVPYRGTKEIVQAAKLILESLPTATFTIAGEGPDEGWMRNELAGFNQVNFTKYNSSDAFTMHSRHEIAIVPSLGSEGTSLAVLEAMAAGCAVIASPVGGITNIILDGYNGLFSPPDAHSISTTVCSLAKDLPRLEVIRRNAIASVSAAFSHEKWKRSWAHVIDEVGATL